MQERRNSSALAMELSLSCTNSSLWCLYFAQWCCQRKPYACFIWYGWYLDCTVLFSSFKTAFLKKIFWNTAKFLAVGVNFTKTLKLACQYALATNLFVKLYSFQLTPSVASFIPEFPFLPTIKSLIWDAPNQGACYIRDLTVLIEISIGAQWCQGLRLSVY